MAGSDDVEAYFWDILNAIEDVDHSLSEQNEKLDEQNELLRRLLEASQDD